jgi:hypothetical protein
MTSTPLFPTFPMPATVDQRQQTAPQVEYKPSYRFDFEKGDFVVDGAGRVPLLDGHAAWGQWVVKTVMTERFAFLAYSNRHGVELDRAVRQQHRPVAEAELARSITEALLQDPRTGAVSDFRFTWRGDELTVRFTASPTIGTPITVEVPLRG